MLSIKDLHVYYGGIHALRGISLDVPEGKVVSLIGANGAGKSTTLRTIVGLERATQGSVTYQGKDITQKPTKDIVESGLVLVPEGRRVFPNLTVKENLILGAYTRKDKPAIEKDILWVYDLFPRLKKREWQKAGNMSGGEQQMLAVGRALLTTTK